MENLEGVVRDIIFQNEENAFCIFRIEDEKDIHSPWELFHLSMWGKP